MAYVGLLEESGSLFAMSPERYPLVLFGSSERETERQNDGSGGESHIDTKTLDSPRKRGYRPDGNDEDEPATLRSGKERTEINDEDSLLDTCLADPSDLRCLVGFRPIEDDSGYEGRLKRLLEGPKPDLADLKSDLSEGQGLVVVEAGRHMDDNSSGIYRDLSEGLGLHDAGSTGPTARMWYTIGFLGSEVASGGTFWEILSLVLGLLSLWLMWKGFGRMIDKVVKSKEDLRLENNLTEEFLPSQTVNQSGKITEDTEYLPSNGFGSPILSLIKELPPLPLSDLPHAPPLKELIPTISSALPATPISEDADDTEGETEAIGTPVTPGKKRVRRGKRGKKKKTTVDGNDVEQEKESIPAEKTSLVLMTSPKTPMIQQPSLVVSDTVLGKLSDRV